MHCRALWAVVVSATVTADAAGTDKMSEIPVVGLRFTSHVSVASGEKGRFLMGGDESTAAANFTMGELVCESLADAEDAPTLIFAITPEENVTAEMTSYYEYEGEIFSDGIARKVWSGRVTNDTVGTLDRAIAMAWGEVCDAETFSLKVVTYNENGTLSVIRTTPCDEGGATTTCVEEVEIEPQDESAGAIPTTVSRALRATTRHPDWEIEGAFGASSVTNGERQLQSCSCDTSPQVDIMLLYTEEGRALLGDINDAQMETKLAEAFSSSREAMENSEIDLSLNLVHVEAIELPAIGLFPDITKPVVFSTNSDVIALRDEHRADLVQLVYDLQDGCVSTYKYAGHQPSLGFSLVDADCLETFSHTHAYGHNLGCTFNREDAEDTETDYAYGFRYCDGNDPFRTIMAKECNNVARINHFSNPDVTELGKPTGQDDANCAQAIRDNMEAICMYRNSCTPAPSPAPSPAPTPSPTPNPTPSPTPAPIPSPTPTPKRAGRCTGDPHCQTFDGVFYDCHGQGDFVLVEATATETEVHVRFELSIWSEHIAVTTGVAAREGNSTLVEVLVSPMTVFADGALYIAGITQLNGVTIQVSSSEVEIEFLSGLIIVFRAWSTVGNVYAFAPVTMETTGLLGNNNGAWDDDWETSTGETIEIFSTSQSDAAGTDFCVSHWYRADSIFTTASPELKPAEGEAYVPIAIPEVLPDEVTELCGVNTECIIDTIIAGPEVGAQTLQIVEEFEEILEEEEGLCEENTFSVDGSPPCTDCPEGQTSGPGATACAPSDDPTPAPTTPAPTTPAPTTALNPCLDSTNPDYRCNGVHGKKTINLKSCGLTDEDADMLRACFEVPGNGDVSGITKIKMNINDFTTVPSESMANMTNLATLNLQRNCGLTCVPTVDSNPNIILSSCNEEADDVICA